MKLDRKPVVPLVAVFLALPMLYAVSIGPMLFLTYHLEHRAKLVRGAPINGGPIYWRVYGFYAPLRRVTNAASLGSPLSAYLRLWHIPLFKVTLAGKTGTAQPVLSNTSSTPAPRPQQ